MRKIIRKSKKIQTEVPEKWIKFINQLDEARGIVCKALIDVFPFNKGNATPSEVSNYLRERYGMTLWGWVKNTLLASYGEGERTSYPAIYALNSLCVSRIRLLRKNCRYANKCKRIIESTMISERGLYTITSHSLSSALLKRGIIAPIGKKDDLAIHISRFGLPPSYIPYIKGIQFSPPSHMAILYAHDACTPSCASVNPQKIIGVDIGEVNLFAAAANFPEFVPVIISAKPLRQIYYQYKNMASRLRKPESKKRLKIRLRRTKLQYVRNASQTLLSYIIDNYRAGTLVIGRPWYLVSRINHIPYHEIVKILSEEAAYAGIKVIIIPESYTSLSSFLDGDLPTKQDKFSGTRIRRGLYRSSNGTIINADINAAYQIIRKASLLKRIENPFVESPPQYPLHPRRLKVQTWAKITPLYE